MADSVIETTQAAEMTEAQAAQMGFRGIPADPENRPRKFIVCTQADQRLIANRLEGSNACSGFAVHALDI